MSAMAKPMTAGDGSAQGRHRPDALGRLPGWLRCLARPAAAWLRHVIELGRWYNNPFVLRELHAARRKPPPFALIGWEAALLGGVFFLAALIGSAHASTGISPAWGGALGALVLMPVSLTHFILLLLAVGSRAGGDWVTAEANQGTLPLLLTTPMSPVEIILKRAAVPFLAGLVAMLIPLPLYILAVSMGGVGVGTIVGIYILFAFGAFLQSGPKTYHHITRLAERGPPSVAVGARVGGAHYSGAWTALSTLLILAYVSFGVGGAFGGRFPNPLGALVVAGHALVTPHTFFGVPLRPVIPLLLLTPLLTAVSVMSWSLRLAVHGSSAPPHLFRCWTAFAILLLFVVLGYAWPRLLASGLAGRLIPGVASPVSDLRGILLVLLALTVLYAGPPSVVSRWPSVGLLALCGWEPRPDMSIGRAFAAVCANAMSALLIPLLAFVAACALGGMSPLLAGPAFAGKALAAVAAAILFSSGLGTLCAAPGIGRRGACLRAAGTFVYGVLLCAPLAAPYVSPSPEVQRALSSLCPFGGLMALAHLPDFLVTPAWSQAVLVQLSLAVVCSLAGLWISIERRRAAAPERAAVPAPKTAPAAATPSLVASWDRRCLRIQRFWDNPVLVREIRRGQQKGEGRALLVLVGLALLGLGVVVLRWPGSVVEVMGSFDFLDHVTRLPLPRAAAATITPIVMLGVAGVAWFASGVAGASIIGRERRDGTFAFTMMTPLSPRDILLGAAAAAVYPAALVLAVALVPCLVCTIASLSWQSVLVFITCIIWVVMLAVTSSGLSMGCAALLRFRPSTGAAALPPVVLAFLGIAEAVRIGWAVWMANVIGTGLWLHAANWAIMATEILLGLLGYSIAYRVLTQMKYSELPTEPEARVRPASHAPAEP
jgi:hypothetical protein